ncbi:MAG: M28 family peptidase [Bacteroidales bacterium]
MLFIILSLLLYSTPYLQTDSLESRLPSEPQPKIGYRPVLNKERAKESLTFIANDLTLGRESGSSGSLIVASFLRSRLRYWGVRPFYGESFTQSFIVEEGEREVIGRNIIGILPSSLYSERYIIVSAHYDHLGVLGGNIYQGADDNASGVTALLLLAEWFGHQRYLREGPTINIIFALFDAKERNMAGSNYFANHLGVESSKIVANINIDQIGSSLAPPGKEKDYLLYTASEQIKERAKGVLNSVNSRMEAPLYIDHTFYGSDSFYQIFAKTSDQFSLSKVGIPAIMFTSGITQHTYKVTDTPQYIDWSLLLKRSELIYYFICELIK